MQWKTTFPAVKLYANKTTSKQTEHLWQADCRYLFEPDAHAQRAKRVKSCVFATKARTSV